MGAAENKKLISDALSGVGTSFLDILVENIRWTLTGSDVPPFIVPLPELGSE